MHMQTGRLEDGEQARMFLLLLCAMNFFVFFSEYINRDFSVRNLCSDVRKSRGIYQELLSYKMCCQRYSYNL